MQKNYKIDNIVHHDLNQQDMKVQIDAMHEELNRYHRANKDLELRIEHLQLKLDASNTDLRSTREDASTLRNRIARFCSDLHSTAQLITEPAELEDAVRKLYNTYCRDRAQYVTTVDDDVQHEHNKQREFLERSVAGMRKKLAMSSKMHEDYTTLVMQENVVLIREVNLLRQELKLSNKNAAHLEASLNSTRTLEKMRGGTVSEVETGDLTTTLRDSVALGDSARVIEMQKAEIRKLRSQVAEISSPRPENTRLT